MPLLPSGLPTVGTPHTSGAIPTTAPMPSPTVQQPSVAPRVSPDGQAPPEPRSAMHAVPMDQIGIPAAAAAAFLGLAGGTAITRLIRRRGKHRA